MCNCVIFKMQIGGFCDGGEGEGFEFDPDSMLKNYRICKKCLETIWVERYLYMVKEAAIEDFADPSEIG